MADPDRRQVLRLLAGAAVGCASTRGITSARPRLRLPPVRVAPDRQIRTVVGLRPYRHSGFRVEAEAFGDKRLVHNYGHGGGGVTLSWGTADMAARLALDGGTTRVAVIGAGAVGLATARLLQERGAQVTIYTSALPPETTSNIAGAQWFPFSVCEHKALAGPFLGRLVDAARFAYRRYQGLLGPTYGVRWMANYWVDDGPPDEAGLVGRNGPLRDFLPEFQDLGPGEHPFPGPFVRRFDTMLIEPSIYLAAMLRDVRQAGGAIVVKRFAAAAEVAALPEPVIVNCSGLGAGALFGDPELEPVKGQLHVLLPQPEVDYAVLAGDLYMFSRQDGVLLGGTHERGVATLEPNPDAHQRILDGHARLFQAVATAP